MEVVLARQPIFTKNKKLFGYELLFRSGINNAFPDIDDAKPNELIRFSIIWARMCEKFSQIFKSKFSVDELFTLGLFSYMDALMDCKMEDILQHFAFSDKMKEALLGNDREFSRMLDIIIGFEKGNWNQPIFKILAGTDIEKKLPGLYSDAINMANAFYG